jgi:hypothetical protein
LCAPEPSARRSSGFAVPSALVPARSYGEVRSVVVRALLVPGSRTKTTAATGLEAGTKTYAAAPDWVDPSRLFAAERSGLAETRIDGRIRDEAAGLATVVTTSPVPMAATTATAIMSGLVRNLLGLLSDGAR